MKALVTGGAGFVGSNIVRLLVEEGHTVTVLDNLSSGHRANLLPFPDVRLTEGDIRDKEAVSRAIADVDVIFHLAASVGNTRSIEYPVEDSEINVIGTLNILEVARRNNVRKIVYSSSAGIFGQLKTLPIREDHPIAPDSPYGASKLAGEKHCLAYCSLYGIEVVCLRYFNVYGLNQRFDAYGNVIPIFAHRIYNADPIVIFGDGEQTRDFVNVRDVAQANYLAALSDKVTGAFNLGSGSRVTINRLAEMMMEVAEVRVPIEHVSPRSGDVQDSLADINAAQQTLRFAPKVLLLNGLQEYMGWVQDNQDSLGASV